MSLAKEMSLFARSVRVLVQPGGTRFSTRSAMEAQGQWEISSPNVSADYGVKFPTNDDLQFRFNHLYPDIVHFLTKDNLGHGTAQASTFTKLLTRNMSTTVLGRRYGLLVPRTFLEMGGDQQLVERAMVLGWAVEVHRASVNIKAQIINDRRLTSTGDVTAAQSGLKRASINHALLMSSGVFSLLDQQLEGEQIHLTCQQAFIEALRRQAWAINMDPRSEISFEDPLRGFDMKRFKSLCYNTKSYPKLVLPVSLGLNMAGVDQKNHPEAHALSSSILRKIGEFEQIRRNYAPNVVEDDISTGRVTWLIAVAKQRASNSQRRQLVKNYGSDDKQSLQRVKEIYQELRLDLQVAKHLEKLIDEIEIAVNRISKSELLPQSLFFKILGEISSTEKDTFLQPSFDRSIPSE